jgi:hypothetical protein
MRNSNFLKNLYNDIRSATDEKEQKRLKQKLYYWTPHCSQFRSNNRSLHDALRPQRRVTLDFDENKGRSREICQKALKLKSEKGWLVSLVEESATGGTHVIVEILEGMTAQQTAMAFAQDLGETLDTSMLSIEHCLFMTPYTLYIDEELLFRDTFVSEEDAKATWTKENGKPSTTAPDCPPETGGRAQSAEGVDNHLTSHRPSSSFPTHDENGHDLRELANALIVKHCQNGHQPIEGERHTLLKRFAPQMALKCENNPEWLSQVLPTYGLDEAEFRSIVQWACSLPQKA